MKRLLLILGLCMGGGVYAVALAQDAPRPAPYTEVESLRIENANLERALVQRALTDWQQKVAKLKADLERARPGFVWNPETGEWSVAKK